MLNHAAFAQVSLSLLCTIQGLATLALDFNRTHATNPLWPGHARFHVVWQSVSVASFSILEVVLIWWQGPFQREGFYLASILAGVPPLGFLVAWLGRRIFKGTLSDPNGIPPARLTLRGRRISVDLNLVAVVAALLSLPVIVAIY